jgi:hypothetical protein
VGALDIIGGLEALTLCLEQAHEEGANVQDGDICGNHKFLEFLKKGTAGRAIFTEFVVPFLWLNDLLKCAKTCRKLNTICRTYTIGEVLSLYSMDHVARTHKLELGKLIMASVSQTHGDYPQRRFVRCGEESYWARLYHPSVLRLH